MNTPSFLLKNTFSMLLFSSLLLSTSAYAVTENTTSMNTTGLNKDVSTSHANYFNGHYGRELTSLDQAKKALASGAVVSATLDLDKCSLSSGSPSRNLAGGLKIDSYLIKRDGSLNFSSFRTTLSSRSDVAVTQNNKYSVASNGDVTFTSSVFSMPDYNLISKVDVYCKLNESFRFYMAF